MFFVLFFGCVCVCLRGLETNNDTNSPIPKANKSAGHNKKKHMTYQLMSADVYGAKGCRLYTRRLLHQQNVPAGKMMVF